MSAWVAVDKDGDEIITTYQPFRATGYWNSDFDKIYLPKGSIKRLIGHTLTWESEPAELKEDKPYSLDNPNDIE